MRWRYGVIACALLTLTGCYKYNTHLGRVGKDNSPFTAQQPGTDPVRYGSTPMNIVPDLVKPVTRTVWIKGHQLPNGDYVGDYPLTIIFTRAEFVHEDVPDVLIPHSIKSTDRASPDKTPVQPRGQTPPRTQSGVQHTVPHVTDYIKQLQHGGTHALPQLITPTLQDEGP